LYSTASGHFEKKKHPSINTAYVPLQVIFVPVDSDAYRH
jgi:hypothetical protein